MYIIAIASCFSAVSTVFVLLRLYTRFYLINHPGIDDYIIILALCFAWCSFAFLVQEVHNGSGQPIATLSPETMKLQVKALWLSIPFYNLSLTLTKAAIISLYLRIFPTPKFVLATRILVAVIVVYGLWTVLSAFLNCLPVNSFWDPSVPGHCIPRAFLWYFNGALNIATDLAILVLPIPALSQLRLAKMRQKVGVILIFATGSFACITSMIRLNYLRIAVYTSDPSKDGAPIALWSNIEVNSGIICCCLPPLKPLIMRIFPRLLASAALSGSLNGQYQYKPSGPSSDSYPKHSTNISLGRYGAKGDLDLTVSDGLGPAAPAVGRGGRSRSYQSDEIVITHEVRMESYERDDDVVGSDTASEWGFMPREYVAGGLRN